MNKKIKQSLAIVTSAALAFSAVVASSANAAGTYTIAYQGPLSGGEASTGTDELNAVKYAAKIFMAKNKGFKIKSKTEMMVIWRRNHLMQTLLKL